MLNEIRNTDCLKGLRELPNKSVNCCITSPPYYGLRDYGVEGQIGLEETPEEYIKKLGDIFDEVRRVLKDDGTLWLNLGDSYAGSGCGRNSDGNIGTLNSKKQRSNTGANIGNLHGISKTGKGLKSKDLIGIPWLAAFELRSRGWYLRQDIIWHKPNPMPESVTDRCTKAHEYIFLMAKSQRYYYDAASIAEACVWDKGGMTDARIDRAKEEHKAMPTSLKNGIKPKKKGPQTFGGKKARDGQENGGDPRNGHRADENSQWGKTWDSDSPKRNKRSVWTIATMPYSEAHFATFPEKLIVDMIKAGCPEGGIILDPFMGAGTTAVVARKLNRNFIGFELNADYIKIAEKRLYNEMGMFL